MAARPKTLRAAFEQLALDFAGALIAAVAAAPMPDVIAAFGSPKPATVRRARQAPPPAPIARPAPPRVAATSRVEAAPAPRARVAKAPPPRSAPRTPKKVARKRPAEVETPTDNAILDPAALLMMVEQAEEAPESRVEARREVEILAPPPSTRQVAPGPGQDVLRTTGGSIVLRRKRGANGAPKDAAE